MSPRTEQQFQEIRENKREQILEAALKCFSTNGYYKASIAEIAKEAGISKGLIYNYFESKDVILKELVWGVYEEFFKRFEFPKDLVMTEECFVSYINISIDIVADDPNRFKLYFALFTQPHIMDLFKADLMQKMEPFILMFLNYYTEKGYENPMAMMRFVSAAIDGVQMHIMLDKENFPVEDVRKILLKMFV
ncbi:MAG: TetR/AcrR family transcriptional regulator [Cyclobacteriaceae bacterium]|nr:TetR/AcrR family transcriptional regulator [Cyclobacteriaceae bacterium]